MSNTSLQECPPAAAPSNRRFRLIDPALESPVSRPAESDQPDRVVLCDRCGSEMTFLGLIPPGRLSSGMLVFRCYTCNRVISTPPT